MRRGSRAVFLEPARRWAARCLAGPREHLAFAGAPSAFASAARVAGVSAPEQRRRFSGGPHFGGAHFGGFGGFQQPPPRANATKFYDLLDVSPDASEADIKKAYKKKAMKHHPDRGGDEGKFKEISRAYEVLGDAEKRKLYDAYGEEGLNGAEQGGGPGAGPGAGFKDPFDIFREMFGFNGGFGAQPRGKPRTQDSRYELSLTLEELYAGTARNINFKREKLCKACDGWGGQNRTVCPRCKGAGRVLMMKQMGQFITQSEQDCDHCGGRGYTIQPGDICKTCNGKGTEQEKRTFRIDVEPGMADGTEFRFRGQADEAPGHDTGDVVIAVREEQHKTFARVKDMLFITKKISLLEALTGFSFVTKFLDGKDLVISSQPGEVVRPGDVMVVEGKGMPRPHGQRPGHLYVVMEVDFPERLDADTQKAVNEALGGPPLEDAPEEAKAARKLNPRQSQELRARLGRR